MESAYLAGKVGLVTGAGSGIGRASALALAGAGAKVAVVDIDGDGGAGTVKEIEAAGGSAVFLKADVSDSAQVTEMVQAVLSQWGRLDLAHNNAGIEGSMGPTGDVEESAWDRLLAVNLKGVFLCMRAEIGAMLATGGGAIVNTASIAGIVGFQGLPAYTASKFGVVGLTKSAALEYAKAGIRVNAICPGVIQTAMVDRLVAAVPEVSAGLETATPVGRLGAPSEIGEAVAWLCSDRASFVTGHALVVDGGYTAQ